MNALWANATCLGQHFVAPAEARQERGLTNWNYQSDPIRKPVQSEGGNSPHVTVVSAYSDEARSALNDQISNLQRNYGFIDQEDVRNFLVTHRTIRIILGEAITELRATFGANRIFNLEVSKDEDGSETMYAVAIWQEDAHRALEAFDNFLENWWLQRMSASTSDLAFAYQLV